MIIKFKNIEIVLFLTILLTGCYFDNEAIKLEVSYDELVINHPGVASFAVRDYKIEANKDTLVVTNTSSSALTGIDLLLYSYSESLRFSNLDLQSFHQISNNIEIGASQTVPLSKNLLRTPEPDNINIVVLNLNKSTSGGIYAGNGRLFNADSSIFESVNLYGTLDYLNNLQLLFSESSYLSILDVDLIATDSVNGNGINNTGDSNWKILDPITKNATGISGVLNLIPINPAIDTTFTFNFSITKQ
ncbi:MAG: hypothetical protein NXI20_02885 [bacterium]|nr:hypothetical protein [bacterium]